MNTFMSYLQYMRSSSSEQRDEMLDISDMNIEKQNAMVELFFIARAASSVIRFKAEVRSVSYCF